MLETRELIYSISIGARLLVLLIGLLACGGACACCYFFGKESKPKHGVKIEVEYGKFEKPPQTP